MFLSHMFKYCILCNFEAKIEILLGFGGDKRVKAWRNGLKPLKKWRNRAKQAPRERNDSYLSRVKKPRPVAKQLESWGKTTSRPQLATTRRIVTDLSRAIQRQIDESSPICHDSSHTHWSHIFQAEQKRWLVAPLVSSFPF